MSCTDADKYVTNSLGYTSENPCGFGPFGWVQRCDFQIAQSWYTARNTLVRDLIASYERLRAIEESKGALTYTNQFEQAINQIIAKDKELPQPDTTYSVPFRNSLGVQESISLMQSAGCWLEEINAKIRVYNQAPPPTTSKTKDEAPSSPIVPPNSAVPPQGGTGAVPRTTTRPPSVTERIGQGTLLLLGLGLVGGALYVASRSRASAARPKAFMAIPGRK